VLSKSMPRRSADSSLKQRQQRSPTSATEIESQGRRLFPQRPHRRRTPSPSSCRMCLTQCSTSLSRNSSTAIPSPRTNSSRALGNEARTRRGRRTNPVPDHSSLRSLWPLLTQNTNSTSWLRRAGRTRPDAGGQPRSRRPANGGLHTGPHCSRLRRAFAEDTVCAVTSAESSASGALLPADEHAGARRQIEALLQRRCACDKRSTSHGMVDRLVSREGSAPAIPRGLALPNVRSRIRLTFVLTQ
jgi:hypothetical protein